MDSLNAMFSNAPAPTKKKAAAAAVATEPAAAEAAPAPTAEAAPAPAAAAVSGSPAPSSDAPTAAPKRAPRQRKRSASESDSSTTTTSADAAAAPAAARPRKQARRSPAAGDGAKAAAPKRQRKPAAPAPPPQQLLLPQPAPATAEASADSPAASPTGEPPLSPVTSFARPSLLLAHEHSASPSLEAATALLPPMDGGVDSMEVDAAVVDAMTAPDADQLLERPFSLDLDFAAADMDALLTWHSAAAAAPAPAASAYSAQPASAASTSSNDSCYGLPPPPPAAWMPVAAASPFALAACPLPPLALTLALPPSGMTMHRLVPQAACGAPQPPVLPGLPQLLLQQPCQQDWLAAADMDAVSALASPHFDALLASLPLWTVE
jgi:hypothetical protein